jgi:hypothetical protein
MWTGDDRLMGIELYKEILRILKKVKCLSQNKIDFAPMKFTSYFIGQAFNAVNISLGTHSTGQALGSNEPR